VSWNTSEKEHSAFNSLRIFSGMDFLLRHSFPVKKAAGPLQQPRFDSVFAGQISGLGGTPDDGTHITGTTIFILHKVFRQLVNEIG
jgi:hypothetical protein